MTPDPLILVLEDERAQLLTLRAQLSDIGCLADFSDPLPALAFARDRRCDAAIIDIRMPRCAMDGIEFLRALREFDQELAVIVRTADESDRIADGAIELRASRRAIKSKTSLAELRRITAEAIRETRARRAIAADARVTARTKTQLAAALGLYDLRLAAAELNRGLVQGLRGELTALSALGSLLRLDADRLGDPDLASHAFRAEERIAGMVDAVNASLDGPFGEGRGPAHAAVNASLDALRKFLHGAERWASERKTVVILDLPDNTLVAAAPLDLTNGLRHLLEYFLLRTPAGSEVTLASGLLHSPAALAERIAAATVLNRSVLRPDRPYVSFRAAAALPEVSLDELRDAFSFSPQDGRIGNLNVLAQALSAADGAAFLSRRPAGALSVEVVVPVAL